MKIAIDIRTAGGEKTGKGFFTFHLVQNLLKIDSKNEYILYTKEKVPGFEQFKNATLKPIKGASILWHLNTAKDAKKENVDIFFAPTSYITPIFLDKKIKVIIAVHDLVAFLFPNTHNKKAVFIERLLLKRALKKADKIIAVSQNTKRDLLSRFKLPQKKIDIIYCAASEDFKPLNKETLTKFSKETNLPEKFFLAVGTIEPRKNYINLIRAFAEVKPRFPNHHLIIVGKNGWDFEPVYKEIRENYLTKNVHILGYLSGKNLVNLYNLAQAFVFPSFYEGFGIPPLEAMKCGCPVISSYTSSLPEVVGDSALLIDPSNHLEIAGAMLKIIQNDDLHQRLQNAGLLQARKFSWEDSAKNFLAILKQLS